MKHPTEAQWLDFAYGEVTASQRLDLETHLAVCPDCARQVDEWRRTGQQLDGWRIEVAPTRQSNARHWSWAAAAAALLLGVAAGRWSFNPAELRGQIAADLRTEFDQALHDTSAQLQLARQQDQQFTLDLFKQVEARRMADRVELREQLETVAVYAESGLQRAQNQLRTFALRGNPDSGVLPASYSQP